MDKSKELEWTGERLTTSKDSEIAIHHLHRYALALDYVKDKVVLDIASGEGYGTNLFSSIAKQVIGVDIDEKTIQFAQSKYKKSNVLFKTGSADKIPLTDNSVDVVISFETLEHHDKHEEMLLEVKRVLKPDGILIISSPDKLNYTDATGFQNPFHVKELYREEFKALIGKHFTYTKMYYQNISYGSILVSEDGKGKNFAEYDGDFYKVNKHPSLAIPMYNLCIASNNELSDRIVNDFSIFNATSLFQAREEGIYNSKTYRMGKLIAFPLLLFRKLLTKKT